MKTAQNTAPLSYRVPERCSSCHRAFDQQDSHRQIRTLEGQFALCSDCTWQMEHLPMLQPA